MRCVPRTQRITDHGKSRRCRLGHVISCVQSQLITWDVYTDHQGTDDQCALMISVAPAVPAVSVHQCHNNATYQCLPVHINATYQCPSELPSVSPISASQCHLSMAISATYQCCQSVPPISASQCRLS
ncbi:unnamed protein product, partial [Staurois parvus]